LAAAGFVALAFDPYQHGERSVDSQGALGRAWWATSAATSGRFWRTRRKKRRALLTGRLANWAWHSKSAWAAFRWAATSA
jgi:hypothetical protein